MGVLYINKRRSKGRLPLREGGCPYGMWVKMDKYYKFTVVYAITLDRFNKIMV